MDFLRGEGIKETLDIGDKDFQMAQRVEEEAKRLGLVPSPTEEPWNLFPNDEGFEDISQWVHPDDNKSGLLFCRYAGFKEERKEAAEYHILFINHTGNSEWDEHQANFEDGMGLLRKSLSWKDLSSWIER